MPSIPRTHNAAILPDSIVAVIPSTSLCPFSKVHVVCGCGRTVIMGVVMSDHGVSPEVSPNPDEPVHLVNGDAEGSSNEELSVSESEEDADESMTPSGYVLLAQNDEELEEGEEEPREPQSSEVSSSTEAGVTSRTTTNPTPPVTMEEGELIFD